MCQSLLAAGAVPQKLFAEQEVANAFPPDAPLEVVTASWMAQASELASTSGVIGIFSAPTPRKFRYEGEYTLALDAIQNPGNLGTLARTADWFGVHQLLCSPDSADLYAPKALQATMGAIAHIHARYEPLNAALDTLPPRFPIVALDMSGTPLAEWSPPSQGVILVGNEGRGVAPELLQRATDVVAIPCVGQPATDSLNAAIAAAIVLAHLRR